MDRREGWDGRLCNQGVIKTNDSKIFRYPDSLRRSTLKHLGGDDIGGRKNPIHRIAPPRFFQKVRNARIVILLVVFLTARTDFPAGCTILFCHQ